MASHEFRTPLSTILSSAALISKYTKSDEQDKRDKHIIRIKDSVKHLNNMLEDFLSLGKLDEGRIKAESVNFNLNEFLEEVIDEMKFTLKAGQTISPNSSGRKEIFTDKRLFKNILINLLSNAIKFSAEQSLICLDVQNEINSITISVRDEGVGISEEDQHHLFTSFFREKT